jgi:hypothetical protein
MVGWVLNRELDGRVTKRRLYNLRCCAVFSAGAEENHEHLLGSLVSGLKFERRFFRICSRRGSCSLPQWHSNCHRIYIKTEPRTFQDIP